MIADLYRQLKASNRLPSPPGVALRILQLSRSDNASLDDLAKTIASDPALASRLLRFVNSPAVGFGHQISTLDEAVNQIGLRGVQLMALSFSLVSSGKVQACPSFAPDLFWSRSLACAVAAKIFANTAGHLDPNETFIMGLLLHIGQLAMACGIPDAYEAVLAQAAARPEELPAIERAQLGATHIDTSARLLEEWKLPQIIWQTIAQTQEAAPALNAPGRLDASRVLCIADVTASLLCDSQGQRRGKAEEILRLMRENFAIDETAWTVLYDQIVRDWNAYGQILSVKAGTDKSFRDLQDEAREQIAALSVATEIENIGIKEQNELLRQRSRIDALTGIANRAAFDERLAGELERARRTQRPLALCMLDIDHFKKINDAHGHQVGDQMLQAVARAIEDSVRKMDIAARYGGEEFAIIAPECDPAKAASLAERLREAVEKIGLLAGTQTLRVTTSVGVGFVRWPGSGRTAGELIKVADARLYDAKRAGRNCCRLEETVMEQAA